LFAWRTTLALYKWIAFFAFRGNEYSRSLGEPNIDWLVNGCLFYGMRKIYRQRDNQRQEQIEKEKGSDKYSIYNQTNVIYFFLARITLSVFQSLKHFRRNK
jgi:hypothetical protein